MAHLHGYSVDDSAASNRRHGVTLRPPEPDMRTFALYADNETDKIRSEVTARVKPVHKGHDWGRVELVKKRVRIQPKIVSDEANSRFQMSL